MGFESLLKSIQAGEAVAPAALLPYLCLADAKERSNANLRLAEVYADLGEIRQARVFIRRSWMLSGSCKEILPLYVHIHSALGDIDAIRAAYKKLGMIEAAKGNIESALKYFNQWQYAYVNHLKLDQYRYDFDILDCIKKIAEPWRFREYVRKEPLQNRKIRLAYLVFGVLHLNSVLVKINCMLARYHDKDRFKVTFFVPEPKLSVLKYAGARETIRLLKSYGCDVILSTFNTRDLNRLRGVASQIFEYQPDVLITSAMLAELEHYFIVSMHPAPIIIGLIQGPPEQFAAPDTDWAISWSKHPLIDAPCDCSLAHIGLDLPDRESIRPSSRKDMSIPDKAKIIMSAGRYVKFQNHDFWKAVLAILARYQDLYYVVAGVSREQVPFIDGLLTPDLSERVMLLGWRKDVLNISCLADVFIDTYPSGGGHVLIDAMALGIPFVSFENNYMKNFDQTDWSVADEFVSIPELIVNRYDFEPFQNVVSKLISDDAFRIRMGALCKERIHESMGDSEKGVRRYEEIILDILTTKIRPASGNIAQTKTWQSKIKKVFLK